MLERYLKIIRYPKDRRALGWLGGGLIVLAFGIWFAIAYYFPAHYDTSGSKSPAAQAEDGGIATGGDVGRDVTIEKGPAALPGDPIARPASAE